MPLSRAGSRATLRARRRSSLRCGLRARADARPWADHSVGPVGVPAQPCGGDDRIACMVVDRSDPGGLAAVRVHASAVHRGSTLAHLGGGRGAGRRRARRCWYRFPRSAARDRAPDRTARSATRPPRRWSRRMPVRLDLPTCAGADQIEAGCRVAARCMPLDAAKRPIAVGAGRRPSPRLAADAEIGCDRGVIDEARGGKMRIVRAMLVDHAARARAHRRAESGWPGK